MLFLYKYTLGKWVYFKSLIAVTLHIFYFSAMYVSIVFGSTTCKALKICIFSVKFDGVPRQVQSLLFYGHTAII